MQLEDLEVGAPWMSEEEAVLSRKLAQGILDVFCARGVNEHAFLALRIDELVVTWLFVRRLEATHAPDGEADGPVRVTAAQVEAVGKCRERLRKAIKELEDYCARDGSPAGTGLAELVGPVVRNVQGGRPFLD